MQLSSIYDPGYSYFWSGNAIFDTPSSSATNAVLVSSAWVYLTVSNSFGCIVSDSVWFNIAYEQQPDTCESAGIFIPNVFIQNNDGFNDSFEIITNNLFVVDYTIFNRWGTTVFESPKNEKKWNCYFRNGKCPSGVYIYFVKYEICTDKRIRVLKCNLMLFD